MRARASEEKTRATRQRSRPPPRRRHPPVPTLQAHLRTIGATAARTQGGSGGSGLVDAAQAPPFDHSRALPLFPQTTRGRVVVVRAEERTVVIGLAADSGECLWGEREAGEGAEGRQFCAATAGRAQRRCPHNTRSPHLTSNPLPPPPTPSLRLRQVHLHAPHDRRVRRLRQTPGGCVESVWLCGRITRLDFSAPTHTHPTHATPLTQAATPTPTPSSPT